MDPEGPSVRRRQPRGALTAVGIGCVGGLPLSIGAPPTRPSVTISPGRPQLQHGVDRNGLGDVSVETGFESGSPALLSSMTGDCDQTDAVSEMFPHSPGDLVARDVGQTDVHERDCGLRGDYGLDARDPVFREVYVMALRGKRGAEHRSCVRVVFDDDDDDPVSVVRLGLSALRFQERAS